MKNSSANKKSQGGFTLVEVIVVAVIVAVLAGVSIPLYNGYVSNSRLNAAANAAGSTASFLGACYQSQSDVTLPIADGAEVTGDGVAELVCDLDNTADDPRLVVPAGFILRRSGNSILGRHESITASGGEGESAPYAFPGPAIAGP